MKSKSRLNTIILLLTENRNRSSKNIVQPSSRKYEPVVGTDVHMSTGKYTEISIVYRVDGGVARSALKKLTRPDIETAEPNTDERTPYHRVDRREHPLRPGIGAPKIHHGKPNNSRGG